MSNLQASFSDWWTRYVSCEITIRWFPLDLTDHKSTLVQVMAWCRQAASHYMSQCWPRSMSPYGVTRPQWVNSKLPLNSYEFYHSPEKDAIPTFLIEIASLRVEWKVLLTVGIIHQVSESNNENYTHVHIENPSHYSIGDIFNEMSGRW